MIGKIKPFNSFGHQEYAAMVEFFGSAEDGLALSGYLAGRTRGGYHVIALETMWAMTFGVNHAVACNSATSGLMAAAFAVGLKSGDSFVCPAMTMSATAATPMFTGAAPYFMDVDGEDFGLNTGGGFPDNIRAIFTTNLFGHPSRLACNEWSVGDVDPVYLIEDNAQSPFAMTHNGRYAGTNGTIGIFSLNVHKPLQCGEGGIVITNDADIALKLRQFINHGENEGGPIGLNLRMTEVCAAHAMVQLRRGTDIVTWRVEQARAIIAAIGDIPGIRPPVVREGCTHVYYTIPFLIEDNRAGFCAALRKAGVPVVEGYVPPLYRLPAFSAFARSCPVAEDLHDRRLFYFENCAYDPTPEQIEQIGAAFRKAAEIVL